MDFLVELSTDLPATWAAEQREELLAREAARGAELRDAGVVTALWRLRGRLANVGIWSVPDAAALHGALTSLPAWPWMTVRVTALAPTRSSRSASVDDAGCGAMAQAVDLSSP